MKKAATHGFWIHRSTGNRRAEGFTVHRKSWLNMEGFRIHRSTGNRHAEGFTIHQELQPKPLSRTALQVGGAFSFGSFVVFLAFPLPFAFALAVISFDNAAQRSGNASSSGTSSPAHAALCAYSTSSRASSPSFSLPCDPDGYRRRPLRAQRHTQRRRR